MIPLTSALLKEDIGWVLAVTWVTLMGVSMSILQTSVFGLVGSLPGKYTGAVMTGLALSGVFIGTIRIITLGIWSDVNNETTSLIGAIIYFVIAGIINVASLFAYHVSLPFDASLSTSVIMGLHDSSFKDNLWSIKINTAPPMTKSSSQPPHNCQLGNRSTIPR